MDVEDGDDLGTGNDDDPFSTITHALSLAEDGERIRARPGTYTAASGETFPLMIPRGVELVGSSRRTTNIEGSARLPVESCPTDPFVSIVLAADATLEDFTIHSDRPNDNRIGVQLVGDRARVRNSTIRGVEQYRSDPGSYGIVSGSGRAFRIENNIIVDNQTGINFVDGGDETRISGNTVIRNDRGVLLQATPATYDLGGGPHGSRGGNVFSCNDAYDLMASRNTLVYAEDNLWDHVPPVFNGAPDRDKFP